MTRRMLTTATQAEKRRRVASCLNKTSRASGSSYELPELFAGWPTLSQLAHDQNILDIGVPEVVILTGKSKCKPSLTFHCHFFGPWWSLNNMILSICRQLIFLILRTEEFGDNPRLFRRVL